MYWLELPQNRISQPLRKLATEYLEIDDLGERQQLIAEVASRRNRSATAKNPGSPRIDSSPAPQTQVNQKPPKIARFLEGSSWRA
jgi:hypothetical protein